MPNKITRAARAALLSLALPLTFSGPAGALPAAPGPLIQITPAQASSFAAAFTEVSRLAHIALVAEDQPLHMTLTPAAVAGLKLNPGGEPLAILLPKLAAAYDYDVQPSGPAFLLKKRYTNPADLPSITVQECALALEETSRYAENFNPHLLLGFPDRSPAIHDLVYSLTPTQLAAMKDIHRGVPVSSLSTVQQQEVQQFLLHIYVQTAINDLPRTLAGLGRISATDPQFSWRACDAIINPAFARRYLESDTLMFGYASTRTDGKPIFITMSKPDQMKTDFDGNLRVTTRSQVVPAPAIPQADQHLIPDDITDPLPTPPDAPAPAPPVSASLGDILTRMNVQAAGPNGDGLKVTIQPYLAPKRATVFGAEATTPRQEVAALAAVYGLRVLTEEPEGGKDRLRVTRRSPTPTLDVAALHDVVDQFLPDPLVRAYRMHPTYGAFDPDSPVPSGLWPPMVYAVRQIRTAAEPKIRASKNGTVALSALSEQEGRAFAVVLVADALDSLRGLLTADPPRELTHFSELRLSGGLYDDKQGKKKLDLLLALPNPNDPTTLQQGMGVGEINYDPVNHTF